MNIHMTRTRLTEAKSSWRQLSHHQKVSLIIEAYKQGWVTSTLIASCISKSLNCKVSRQSIASVYAVSNRHKAGKLKNYPLTLLTFNRTGIDIDEAEKLWRQGISGTAIAEKLGVKMRQIYTLAESNRDRFPLRVAKVRSKGVVVMELTPVVASPKRPAHPDRVTRVTFSGAHVTLPRVTFLDGPASY